MADRAIHDHSPRDRERSFRIPPGDGPRSGPCEDSTSSRRKVARFDEFSPEPDTVIEVDLEDADGGPASRRQAHQHRAIPPKMPRPFVTAGMEQRDDS